MTKFDYARFVTQFTLYNDAAYKVASIYAKHVFDGGLCIDFWYTEKSVNLTIIANKVAHKIKLPSEWLLLNSVELDTTISLLTKDELWSYVS